MRNDDLEESKRYRKAQKKVYRMKRFYMHFLVYVVVNVFVFFSKVKRGLPEADLFQFEYFSTAIYWGVGLFIHWLLVFGGDAFLGSNWEENKIKELIDKEKYK